jgi:hypothetical protein
MGKEIIGYTIKEQFRNNRTIGEAAARIEGYKCFGDRVTELTLPQLAIPFKEGYNYKSAIEKLTAAGVLDLWFEPVYEEKEYKVGDWITFTSLPEEYSRFNGDTVKITNIKENPHNYWYNHEPYSFSGGGFSYNAYKTCFRKATLKEIKNALIAEAKRRGFKEGVKVQSFVHNKPLFCNRVSDNIDYISFEDKLHFGIDGLNYVVIYKNGKWAKILPSYPQIEVNRHNAEFFDWGVKFGCAEIDKHVFIDLYNTRSITNLQGIHNNRSIESVTIGKGIFTKENIKEIAEYYLNK